MEHLLLYTYWDFRIKFCCVKKRFRFYFDQSESRNDFFTRDFSNSCENPVRVRFPWSNLHIFSPQISLIINSASLMRCCECACFTSAWNSIANKLKIRCNTYLSSKLWSSQLWTQFKQLRIEAWKSQDLNPWRIQKVTDSNPVEVLTFSGFYTQLLKLAFITAMIIAYLISNPQFNIRNISYITSNT